METLPSVPAAAHPSILTGLGNSPETVKALVAVIVGLMRETLSEDSFAIAMLRADTLAKEGGVSDAEWNRVLEILARHYRVERTHNPLCSMF